MATSFPLLAPQLNFVNLKFGSDFIFGASLVQPDGKQIISGSVLESGVDATNNPYSSRVPIVLRLLSDGSLDTSFGQAGRVTLTSAKATVSGSGGSAYGGYGGPLTVGDRGTFIVSTTFTNQSGYELSSDGTILRDFNYVSNTFLLGNGRLFKPNDQSPGGQSFIEQPDGDVLFFGATGTYGNYKSLYLKRYNADGSVDAGFGQNGVVVTNNLGTAKQVIVQPDGKLMVLAAQDAGVYLPDIRLARYLADGELDPNFGNGGYVAQNISNGGPFFDFSFTGDGKILAASAGAVVRFTADGQLDTTFDGDGVLPISFGKASAQSLWGASGYIMDIDVLPDGDFLLSGTKQGDEFGVDNLLVIRMNSDGSFDSAFGDPYYSLRGTDGDDRFWDAQGTYIDGQDGVDTYLYRGWQSELSLVERGTDWLVDGYTSLTNVEFIEFFYGGNKLALPPKSASSRVDGTSLDDTLRGTDADNSLYGYDGADQLVGMGGNDHLVGGPGNDALNGGVGNDLLDGGEGIDTAWFNGSRAQYVLTQSGVNYTISGGDEGSDTLQSIERLQFSDMTLALDLDGNAGQVYRLYKAAFARTPDSAGLSGWINALDNGTPLEQVANAFVSSSEFQNVYGTNSGSQTFVLFLYLNALGRAPGPKELSDWVIALDQGIVTRAQLLVQFSESAENKSGVLKNLVDGIVYVDSEQSTLVGNGLTLSGTPISDVLHGSLGKDMLRGYAGNDEINGGAGVDTAVFSGSHADYIITPTSTGLTVSGLDGTDTLKDIERLKFDDLVLAVDSAGNAGQVYRLYQAALHRTPDTAGLTDWVRGADQGMTLQSIAKDFIASQEFQNLYGANPSNDAFVTALYQNAIGRAPDEDGKTYWVTQLNNGLTKEMALIGFSESAENQATVIGVIQNGIELI